MNYYMQLLHKQCSILIYFEYIADNMYLIKYVLEYTDASIKVEPRLYLNAAKVENSQFDLDLSIFGIKFNDCEVKQELISY